MSVDFKVNLDNELVFSTDGQLETVSEIEAIQQGLRLKLNHTKGEYFLDKFYGLDLIYVVTNKKVPKENIDAHIKRMILEYPGVISIAGYRSEINKVTRHFTITIQEIKCIAGSFKYTGGISL
jgi:hypothetical protein